MTNQNDFKPFGTAAKANVLAQADYEKLAALNSGFTAGVAKSIELNKVWRQSSVIAASVAQFMSDTLKADVLDNGNIEDLKNQLIAAIQQTVPVPPDASLTQKGIVQLLSDLANNASDETKATTSKGVNDLLNSKITAPLGSAAYRNVGTGANQIPDMSSFAISNNASGENENFSLNITDKFSIKCGIFRGVTSSGGVQVTYNEPFQNRTIAVCVTSINSIQAEAHGVAFNLTAAGFTGAAMAENTPVDDQMTYISVGY